MAVGSELSSRARKTIFLALLPLAAIAVLFVRNAYARWQPASARITGSVRVRITSSRVTGLYPGAARRLVLALHNGSPRRLVVDQIRVRIASTTKRDCAASASNLSIRQPLGRWVRLKRYRVRHVTVPISMPPGVADACQGAVFELQYTARTR